MFEIPLKNVSTNFINPTEIFKKLFHRILMHHIISLPVNLLDTDTSTMFSDAIHIPLDKEHHIMSLYRFSTIMSQPH